MRLAELHAFHDGEIPADERALALAGGPLRRAYLVALGRRRHARERVRFAVRLIREYRLAVGEGRKRPDDGVYRGHLADFHQAWAWYRACARVAAVEIGRYEAAGRPGDLRATSPGAAMMRDFGRCLLGEAAE